MHNFFTSSAPRFLSGLKECSLSGKMFCPDGAKPWQVGQLEKPIMGCYGKVRREFSDAAKKNNF